MTNYDSLNAGVIIQLFVASLSIIFSILTLIIIKRMNKWNGYVFLVTNLQSTQFIYDFSILLDPCSVSNSCSQTEKFFRFYSGLAVTFWSNVIMFIVAYVVYYYKVIDARDIAVHLFFMINLPSIIIAAVQVNNESVNIYYWLRIISIIVNILLYGLITYKLYQMFQYNVNNNNNNKQDPIQIMAYRLKFYPIVQIICRVGVAWYEGITNTTGFSTHFNNNWPTSTKIAFILYCFTHPAAGIGYFIVFCIVSPGAYSDFKLLINQLTFSYFKNYIMIYDDDNSKNIISTKQITMNPLQNNEDNVDIIRHEDKDINYNKYGDDELMYVINHNDKSHIDMVNIHSNESNETNESNLPNI